MTHEDSTKQPTQMVELKLNMISAESPNLTHSLDQSFNQLLIRKYGYIPISDRIIYLSSLSNEH